MENKKTMEYCAPVVKEIELSNEGVICGSPTFGGNGDAGQGGTNTNYDVL